MSLSEVAFMIVCCIIYFMFLILFSAAYLGSHIPQVFKAAFIFYIGNVIHEHIAACITNAWSKGLY
jgi:hypothetical protein